MRARIASVALALTILSTPLFATVVRAQPAQGNWIVTGMQVLQNESITLNGNLTVQNGGNLTLRNVNLTMNVQSSGRLAITVHPGGSFYVYNSKITSPSKARRFSFIVNGSNFVMKNSELRGAGWCSASTAPNSAAQTCLVDNTLRAESGLVIGTSGALVEDNTFSNNTIGLIVTGSRETIQGNRFGSDDLFALGGYLSSYNTVTNNTFKQNPVFPLDDAVVYFHQGLNNTFSKNTFLVDTAVIQANSTLLTGQWRMDGLKVDSSTGTVITGNNISAANNAVFLLGSHNSIVADNTLIFGEAGVSLLGPCVNARITGNYVGSYPFFGFGASDGIIANLAHNSVIANNKVSYYGGNVNGQGLQIGIYLDHTSNSTVLNNNVTVTQSGSFALLILLGADNDTISANRLSQSKFGVILSGSNRNVIEDNEVLANYSMTLQSSLSNLIYHNDFRDLQEPFGGPFDNGQNSWFKGSQGNYWSHFSGRDQTGNGIGELPYSRTRIPPNGTEPYSSPSPAPILPVAVLQLKPIPLPSSGTNLIIQLIKNQVFELDSGTLSGNITITNSTLLLAKTGPVGIGGGGGSVTIMNSKLTDLGYGFSLVNGCRGGTYCPTSLVIKNSTISGAFLNDLNLENVTILGTTITSSLGDQAVSTLNANSVQIIGSTFSGAISGIKSYCGAAAPAKILYSGNHLTSIVGSAISVCFGTRNVVIANNSIAACLGSGISVSGNSLVEGNRVDGVKGFGSISVNGNNDTIVGNTVSNATYDGIDVSGNGNVLHDNSLTVLGGPVSLQGSGNVVYHNNLFITSDKFGSQAGNSWDSNGEGNYWGTYSGKDPDLDGIGDTPYVNGNIMDAYPFMKPNGWLTKFYLTIATNLPSSTTFSINGSSFRVGKGGIVALRLGYVTTYAISLPLSVALANGSSLAFVKWSDGATSPTRTLTLSANATLSATYTVVAIITTTTTSTTSTSSAASTSTTTASTTSNATSSAVTSATTTRTSSTAASLTSSTTTTSATISSATNSSIASSSSSTTSTGGGIPEFPYQTVAGTLLTILLVLSYLMVRRQTAASGSAQLQFQGCPQTKLG